VLWFAASEQVEQVEQADVMRQELTALAVVEAVEVQLFGGRLLQLI
jgi:hypothetical protein